MINHMPQKQRKVNTKLKGKSKSQKPACYGEVFFLSVVLGGLDWGIRPNENITIDEPSKTTSQKRPNPIDPILGQVSGHNSRAG